VMPAQTDPQAEKVGASNVGCVDEVSFDAEAARELIEHLRNTAVAKPCVPTSTS
jgi:hypothetical protein